MTLESVRPFFAACVKGDIESLRELLAHDATLVNASDPAAQHGGWTGLHAAGRSGQLDAVRLLLEHGADPNAREAGDNSYPLHWAAAHGHLDVARALLDAGGDVHGIGDVHELDVIGWAALFHSPEEDSNRLNDARRAIVSFLAERGARHHVFSAICVGDLNLIEQVVKDNPAALRRRLSRFERGQTPLHFVLNRQRYDVLDLLIRLGADLEAEDSSGQTALATAMLRGDREAMTRLQSAGAKPPKTIGRSVLRDGMATLSLSVKKGVPMIHVPDIGRTLDWYTSIGFKEVARFEDEGIVNFGMVSFGEAEVMFNVFGPTETRGVSLWFYTDQVDRLYQQLKSRQLDAVRASIAGEPGDHQGIVFEQDIEDMFYGARQFAIRDLNGYELYFIQTTS